MFTRPKCRCSSAWRRRDWAPSGCWRRNSFRSCPSAITWMRGRRPINRSWVISRAAVWLLLNFCIDQDSFLPSAIHQLFMPALQLVDGMLATLGTKHATVSNQVLQKPQLHHFFLIRTFSRHWTSSPATAPQSSFSLKTRRSRSPRPLRGDAFARITLCWRPHVCTQIRAGEFPSWFFKFARLIHLTQLSPHSGFGAIHAAVLALATKSLGNGRWLAGVSPQTDAEMLSACMLALGELPFLYPIHEIDVFVTQGTARTRSSTLANAKRSE